MTEPEHHDLGPSASDRWIACTRSHLATKDLPDQETIYSREGTVAHTVAEFARKHQWPASSYHNTVIDGITVDQQMVDGVQAFIDYVNALPGDDYNEERIYYPLWPDGPVAFGTMDAARATWKTLRIIDLKYGEGVKVDAEWCFQLMLYAIGFITKYGWLYDIEDVELHVFQPRLNNIGVWKISVGDLWYWAHTVMHPAARKAIEGTGEFVPGEHCQFCKLRRSCKARAGSMFAVAVGEMTDLDVAMNAPLPPVNTLTNDQIAKALTVKKQLAKWFGDVEEHARTELENGRPVGGWKLVEGRSNRAWAFDKDVVIQDFANNKLDYAALYKPLEIVSVAQAEDKYGKALFKEGGKLAHLVTKPRGSPVLAPADDKRESILANPDNEMEEL